MPHISFSIRDPDDVIKTSVHKISILTLVGMALSCVTKIMDGQRQVFQKNGTVCTHI